MTSSLLSTAQVAELLGITRQTVWCRVKAGTLNAAYKHPGTGAYLFDAAEIEALAAEGVAK